MMHVCFASHLCPSSLVISLLKRKHFVLPPFLIFQHELDSVQTSHAKTSILRTDRRNKHETRKKTSKTFHFRPPRSLAPGLNPQHECETQKLQKDSFFDLPISRTMTPSTPKMKTHLTIAPRSCLFRFSFIEICWWLQMHSNSVG